MRLRYVAANYYFQITRRGASFLTRLVSGSADDAYLTGNYYRFAWYLQRRAYLGACFIIARVTFSFDFENRYNCKISGGSVSDKKTSRLFNSFRYLLSIVQLKGVRVIGIGSRFNYVRAIRDIFNVGGDDSAANFLYFNGNISDRYYFAKEFQTVSFSSSASKMASCARYRIRNSETYQSRFRLFGAIIARFRSEAFARTLFCLFRNDLWNF